jgi:predicted alpha/beta-hydrolase family hydrolase
MRVQIERRSLKIDDPWVDAVDVAVHRPTRPAGAAVLLTHGAGKDLDAPWLAALADSIAAEGRLVVRVNQPWKQSGRAAPPPVHRAVPGFVEVAAAVRRTFGPRRRWVVGGHSNGGRIASHAVAEGLVRTAGLLLLGYPLCAPRHPNDPRVGHWPSIAVPMLVLQGTHDAFGGADAVARHADLPRAPVTLHTVTGADHGFAVPRTRSPDGVRREGATVCGGLGSAVSGWLATAVDASS